MSTPKIVNRIRASVSYRSQTVIKTLRLTKKIRKLRKEGVRSFKMVIGAADTHFEGWLSTDIQDLNILKTWYWKRNFKPGEINAILAEQVWEHFSEKDAKTAIRNCFAYLSDGGNLRIGVPDGFFPSQEYLDWVKPGGIGPGADDHKQLYNHITLTQQLEEAGFEVTLLEYWDQQGQFHKNPWDNTLGYISRSAENDHRNKNGELKMTTLIVDAKKKLK